MPGAKPAGRLGWGAQAGTAAGPVADTLAMRCPRRLPWVAWERCQLTSGNLGRDTGPQRTGQQSPQEFSGQPWDTHPPWQDTVSSNASPSLDDTACRISALSMPSAKSQGLSQTLALPPPRPVDGKALGCLPSPVPLPSCEAPGIWVFSLSW